MASLLVCLRGEAVRGPKPSTVWSNRTWSNDTRLQLLAIESMHHRVIQSAHKVGWTTTLLADLTVPAQHVNVIRHAIGTTMIRMRPLSLNQRQSVARTLRWASSASSVKWDVLLLLRVDLVWHTDLPLPPAGCNFSYIAFAHAEGPVRRPRTTCHDVRQPTHHSLTLHLLRFASQRNFDPARISGSVLPLPSLTETPLLNSDVLLLLPRHRLADVLATVRGLEHGGGQRRRTRACLLDFQLHFLCRCLHGEGRFLLPTFAPSWVDVEDPLARLQNPLYAIARPRPAFALQRPATPATGTEVQAVHFRGNVLRLPQASLSMTCRPRDWPATPPLCNGGP